MFLKKQKPIQSEQAILIEKKIFNSHDDANEIKNLYKMKWGTYNINTSKNSDNKVYFIRFMTKKGKLYFYVDNTTYYNIKIDSLGILTRKNDVFISFELEKIATQEDVRKLNW